MGFTSCLRRNGAGPAEDGPDRGRLDKSGLDRSRLVRNGLVRSGLSGDNPGANAFLTDNGNYILDLQGKEGMDYRLMAGKLKALTGVVETGSVSYTHLDVYKRQISTFFCFFVNHILTK